jgi:hypothetical protein
MSLALKKKQYLKGMFTGSTPSNLIQIGVRCKENVSSGRKNENNEHFKSFYEEE